jgi:uncharacterized protein (DUF305 family)
MQPNFVKSNFLGLTFVAIAISSGMLSGCFSASSNPSSDSTSISQKPSTKTPKPNSMGKMDHGNMSNMSMDLGPADASYDLRFLDGMTPHHQGAVVMAKEAAQKSKRPEILKLASNIIKAQETEIAQMQKWRQVWYPKVGSTPMVYSAEMGHTIAMTPEQMKSMMMSGDLGVADKEFDLRFINAMIPHHEGALIMATDALKKSQRPEIKRLAQTILTSQQAEIQQMKQWRQAWYKK